MSMTRYLGLASASLMLASCGTFGDDENYDTAAGYDTANPYGVPSDDGYGSAPYQNVNPPADNPTYSQAAYEDNSPVTPVAPAASAPPAVARTHVVAKGDTLWGLSRKYDVSVDAIRAANNMGAGESNIMLGTTLNIPAR
jgi:LysM repeat protein